MRMSYQDLRAQEDRLLNAWLELSDALDDLGAIAKQASNRRADIDDVYGAVSRVRRAEEAHDLAELDLATARGEDA